MRRFDVCRKITDKYMQTAWTKNPKYCLTPTAPSRPAKKAHQSKNISRLKNLSRHASVLSESSGNPTPPWSQAPSPDGDESDLEEDDADLDLLIHFNSLKTNFEQEEASQDAGEEEEDGEVEE